MSRVYVVLEEIEHDGGADVLGVFTPPMQALRSLEKYVRALCDSSGVPCTFSVDDLEFPVKNIDIDIGAATHRFTLLGVELDKDIEFEEF